MNSHLKYEKANIELRRAEVLKLLARGYSQRSISEKLNCSNALISTDVRALKEAAQRELRVHIKEVIPFEYCRALAGINEILRRCSEMLDRMTEPKMQLQTMTLLMQLYGQIMSLATDGGIVQEAMKKVEQLQGETKLQNKGGQETSELPPKVTEESSSNEEPEEDLQEE